MDAYTKTKERMPDAGGFSPVPAQRLQTRRRTQLAAVFRTSRRVRYLTCAALVVLGAVIVPTVNRLVSAPPPKVLMAAHVLPAGHVIAPGDLVPVSGRADGALLIPAARSPALVGRRLKLELPDGALAAEGDFGPFPPIGTTVVPVAVKPGQYPPTLQGGDQVAIFPAPGTNVGGPAQQAAHAAASGRVVQVQAATDASGTAVIVLEVSAAQAPSVAQAPAVVLVGLDGQGDLP
jgi:hypothetical protein